MTPVVCSVAWATRPLDNVALAATRIKDDKTEDNPAEITAGAARAARGGERVPAGYGPPHA